MPRFVRLPPTAMRCGARLPRLSCVFALALRCWIFRLGSPVFLPVTASWGGGVNQPKENAR
jgi:hypothetical protein